MLTDFDVNNQHAIFSSFYSDGDAKSVKQESLNAKIRTKIRASAPTMHSLVHSLVYKSFFLNVFVNLL